MSENSNSNSLPVPARRRGRRRAWTAASEQRLLEALREGHYVETACALAGLHRATLYRRLARGRGADAPESEARFVAAVEEARGQAEARLLGIIERAAVEHEVLIHTQALVQRTGEVVELVERRIETDWRAAAWALERMYPQRWGRRVTHRFETMTDEELIEIIAGGEEEETE